MSLSRPPRNQVAAVPESLDSTALAYGPLKFLLLTITAILVFYHLQGGAGFEPTDCWVAQTAREMSEAHGWRGWIVPRFSGETRLQKSPGPYWVVMGLSRLLGRNVDEVTARVPNGLAALSLVCIVIWLARGIAGMRAALFAGYALAASGIVLYWSHRGASDLGLAALTTGSLACIYGAITETRHLQRGLFWLGAYFLAGLGMLYKLPMPIVCVGLPAFVYIVISGRWRLLASWWHIAGLVVFCLPWVPWAATVILTEPTALFKWRTEFLDRFTGDLPNVEQDKRWSSFLLYPLVAVIFCLPFSLSLPRAIWRGFIETPGVERPGRLFLVIWFFSHLAFFTAATGKETRYFLPALPPLFVLLGIELAQLFSLERDRNERRERMGMVIILLGIPAGLVGAYFGLRAWYRHVGMLEGVAWADVFQPALVAALLLTSGMLISVALYWRRMPHASFGALVAGVWVTWLWAWPQLLPIIVSQKPFRDFAGQLNDKIPRDLDAEIRQIGTQDARIIWYSDRRFPRIIDQLELLKMQGGKRSLKHETMLIGEEMVKQLRADPQILMVAHRFDFVDFMVYAPPEVERRGEKMPPVHLWLQTRLGGAGRQFILFGNKPPPWPEPVLDPPSERLGRATMLERVMPTAPPSSNPAQP